MSWVGDLFGQAGPKGTLRPGRMLPGKMSRTGARPDCGGGSADFREARPPARHVDRRQHVAFALGRDRQRPPGVQKVEEAIFQRAPFVSVKLGMAEVGLVEHRGVRRPALGTGALKQALETTETHLPLPLS